MTPEEAQHKLDRLRENRRRKGRETGIGATFEAQGRDLKRLQRRMGPMAEAWLSVCPPSLLERTAIDGISRGVLTIRVDSHATRYTLDRILRAGGERDFIKGAPMTVRRLKLVVDESWAGEPGPGRGGD